MKTSAVVVIILFLQSPFILANGSWTPGVSSFKNPAPIKQGPIGMPLASTTDAYWYQSGAMGTAASSHYVGANVTIRTVYDKVNNDAHSYWIGGYISNDSFIQVGYLNGLSTRNQPYCCAWFFEYFPSPNSDCCAPVIGPEGSAGPIGSWHTYSMVHAGGGVWSFYMDGRLLGSTPNLGSTDSGVYAPAGIAEVAQASTNTDVLGPAEFKDLWFRTSLGPWQPVPSADSFIWYGSGTPSNPPANRYGVHEVEGVDNDFLAGTDIPQLNSPSRNPGPSLWPTLVPPNSIEFTLVDLDGAPFTPTLVSLRPSSGTGEIFYTAYQNQRINSGSWVVNKVVWHTVNVALPSPPIQVPSTAQTTIQSNVFSVRLHVIGYVSGLPVNGATVFALLPDSLNITAKTDSSGAVVLTQLPPSSYFLRVTVPYGIPAIMNWSIQDSGELTARVLSSVEVVLIIALPILGAVIVVYAALWRERLRRASMPTIPPSYAIAAICVAVASHCITETPYVQTAGPA